MFNFCALITYKKINKLVYIITHTQAKLKPNLTWPEIIKRKNLAVRVFYNTYGAKPLSDLSKNCHLLLFVTVVVVSY